LPVEGSSSIHAGKKKGEVGPPANFYGKGGGKGKGLTSLREKKRGNVTSGEGKSAPGLPYCKKRKKAYLIEGKKGFPAFFLQGGKGRKTVRFAKGEEKKRKVFPDVDSAQELGKRGKKGGNQWGQGREVPCLWEKSLPRKKKSEPRQPREKGGGRCFSLLFHLKR